MINYLYHEEKVVALLFADKLGDSIAQETIKRGEVFNESEAIHLSQFFWTMVNASAEGNIVIPCEGSSQYWTEKLYNSFGGYLEKIGYQDQWHEEIDKA